MYVILYVVKSLLTRTDYPTTLPANFTLLLGGVPTGRLAMCLRRSG